MTDIVERLRTRPDDLNPELKREAADEIERLRATERESFQKYVDANEALIEAHAALESLTEDPPATLDEPDEDWEVIVKMRAIARAALPPSERGGAQ